MDCGIISINESPHLPDIRDTNTRSTKKPLHANAQFLKRICKVVKGDRFFRKKGGLDTHVIHQILTHARQIQADRLPHFF